MTRLSRRAFAPTLGALAIMALMSAPAGTAAEVKARSSLDRRISSPAVVESSGLARSTYARDILWTHNDSGAGPVVYAIGKDGRTRATVRLGGAEARDWEDITSGPHHKLWVGDVGDNSLNRSTISVYRFREPRTLSSRTVDSTRFDLSYPDGRHNSEGIMVNPASGRLFVVTKSVSGGAIYRAPARLSTTSVNRLKKLAKAPAKITAASFAPGGKAVVLCNYSTAFVYHRIGGGATTLTKPPLRQGESLDVNRGGSAIFMGSEGTDSPVYRVAMPAGF